MYITKDVYFNKFFFFFQNYEEKKDLGILKKKGLVTLYNNVQL